MSTEFDGYLVEHPGFERTLTWPTHEALEGAASASLIASMLSALQPLIKPLSIDVILHAYQREPYAKVELAHPYWFLVASSHEAELGAYTDVTRVRRRADALTPEMVEALINEAGEAQKLGPEIAWACQQVSISTVEARIPEVLARRDVLSLEVPGGDIGIKVARRSDGAWISGAECRTDLQPFELRLDAPADIPTLDITTCWSMWMPGGPGESDLERVLQALVARGWYRPHRGG